MKNHRFLFLLAFALLLVSCKDEEKAYFDPRGTDYAGAESCAKCHTDIAHYSATTSHVKATAPANLASVLGSFKSGKNEFVYGSDSKITLEQKGDSLFQTWHKNGKVVTSHPFDIVFGGKNAQTAVYWKNGNTFELPVSFYHSANGWGTSPGFSPTEPNFDRKILKDCYGCHSSNVRNTDPNASSDKRNFLQQDIQDIIVKEKIIFGIDCERCHGPAKKHVDYHTEFPDVKVSQYIKSFKSLSKQQKLEACSICHSGNDGFKMKSRFDFKPGDVLTDYYRPMGNAEVDVHGNQYGMLTQSKCFTKSTNFDCTTCHDPHSDAPRDPEFYARICSSCHAYPTHSKKTLAENSVQDMQFKCVECHMPKRDSRAITFYTAFNSPLHSYQLRTHKIAVYPKKSAK
ncbi:multiheme c-type cytochrome [Flavobacterium sp.]|uniref:multiheme c-type cytochrome n=1 Tax=Flavobacterium sp. TaxID=239 RepID=UPI0012199F6A|nr:multiheme c-type cytochrome [Flavobacterium sp.]RZJ73698.1 MAG: hypothetical protein EOO49_01755 [Flavobacterium sp.]